MAVPSQIKRVSLLVIGALSFLAVHAKDTIKLTNPLLKMFDGVTGALDGHKFRGMLHLRREGRKVQYGVRNPATGKFVGKYEYEGSRYSVHQLAQIEDSIELWRTEALAQIDARYVDQAASKAVWEKELEEIEKGYQDDLQPVEDITDVDAMRIYRKAMKDFHDECATKQTRIKHQHIENKAAYDQEVAAVEAEYARRMAPLKVCLEQAKKDVQAINEPYLKEAAGIKKFLFVLVEESCAKRNKPYSFLFTWAEAPEGREFEQFDEYMTSLRLLDSFCTDLSGFFEDLINSCEKGWQQCLALSKAQ